MEDMHSIPRAIVEAIEAGIPATKAFRIYSDKSIPEVAELAQLEPRRLCLIEAGLRPTRSEAMAIGRALDIPSRLVAPAF